MVTPETSKKTKKHELMDFRRTAFHRGLLAGSTAAAIANFLGTKRKTEKKKDRKKEKQKKRTEKKEQKQTIKKEKREKKKQEKKECPTKKKTERNIPPANGQNNRQKNPVDPPPPPPDVSPSQIKPQISSRILDFTHAKN